MGSLLTWKANSLLSIPHPTVISCPVYEQSLTDWLLLSNLVRIFKRMKRVLFLLVTLTGVVMANAQVADLKNLTIVDYLTEPGNELGLVASDLKGLQITDDYTSHNSPINYVYVRQSVEGRPIFDATAALAMLQGEVVYINSDLVTNIRKRNFVKTYSVGAEKALAALAQQKSLYIPDDLLSKSNSEKFSLEVEELSDDPLRFELGYLHNEGDPRLVWRIFWYLKDHSHAYDAAIDANTGEVVRIQDQVLYCDFGHADHCAEAAHTIPAPSVQHSHEATKTNAAPTYEVFAIPTESPRHGPRTVVSDPSDADASPFGWHDIDGQPGEEFTTTRGNNVLASEDRSNRRRGTDPGFGTMFDGGSSMEFTTAFDINRPADQFLNAATVNLFYMNNIMHDVFWHYGFDEPAGNFQENNYGNGGAGSDFVNADAQDGSGSNNANFFTPNDGSNPRMQMYLWQVASGNTDFLQVNSPGSVAGKVFSVQGGFGPRLTSTPVTADLVIVDDGSSSPAEGCQNLQNGAAVNGKIAVIDRGNCLFVEKIQNAQAAGAVGVIMVNNVGGAPITMGGSSAGINIPSIMITQNAGASLKSAIASGSVNASLYDSSGGGALIFDSDFDNGVIAHEYGHGISIRLTGGPNSSCLVGAEQMGEGWSDFLTLVMTHPSGAKAEDPRGVGTYLRNQPTNGRGIRPYPYSVDRTVNPATYDFIKNPQFTVPHGVGSVWCTMLWDLYWALIDEYGYDEDLYRGTGGNNIAIQLVVEGLKLQGCGPGFVDGRDAILAADKLLYGGKNQRLIWEVFAARGLGYSSDQGTVQSRSDGTQAFDLPPSLGGYTIEKLGPADANSGDTIEFTLKIRTSGLDDFKDLIISDTMSSEATYLDSDPSCNFQVDGQVLTLGPLAISAGDSLICNYRAVVKEGIGGAILIDDDMEDGDGDWTSVTTNGGGAWARVKFKANSGEYSWFISDPPSESDRSLQTEVDLTGIQDAALSFYHDFDTEDGWDGAVVEIEDGGQWRDLGPQMITNGYNNNIETNPASAISGRPAFSGNSNGFIQTVVDLTPFVGNKHNIRFRFVSDGLEGGVGWYIDDVSLVSSFDQVENTATVVGGGLKPASAATFTSIYASQDTTTNGGGGKDTVIVLPDTAEVMVFYPNPVSGEQDLQVRYTSKRTNRIYITMHDLLGRSLWEGYVQANQSGTVPMRHLPSGMYILEIEDISGNEYIRQVVKTN